ncbi:MAG: oligopeptide/dipeptide ABC transporter ATP-binding protein [Bacillota bacterium]
MPGSVPNLLRPPPGCRFHPRCAEAEEICTRERPPETVLAEGRMVACWQRSPAEVEP